MSISVSDHIQELINQYPVMVFSKTLCPYCRTAKEILSKYPLEKKYHVLELDQISNGDHYQTELKNLTGDRTVPRIFINGKCIGDEDDLKDFEKQGALQKLTNEQ